MADDTSPAPIDSPWHRCDMPFRFLDLSPELRNHVYSYATEPGGPRLYYLHLTQVCRQLRSEFRPHYLSNTWMEEHIQDIERYLDAMVPQWRKYHDAGDETFTDIAIVIHCLDPYRGISTKKYPFRMVPSVHIKIFSSTREHRANVLKGPLIPWDTTDAKSYEAWSELLFGKHVEKLSRCGTCISELPEMIKEYVHVVLKPGQVVDDTAMRWLCPGSTKMESTKHFLRRSGLGEADRNKCAVWLGLPDWIGERIYSHENQPTLSGD